MSKYTFTFKKGNIFVEFTTEDREVVERQFQIWVTDADRYARMNKSKSVTEKTINILSQENERALQGEPTKAEVQQEKPVEQTIPVQPEIVQESVPETAVVVEPKEETQILDKASTLLKTINSIQNEQDETVPVEDQLQAVQPEVADFESVLEKSIESSTFEPEKPKDPVFLNLLNSKGTQDKFHYLIITSYYLSEFEKMERFSLKQINAKLMQNVSEVIDHSMLQEALNQNLLELVPDLTGVSEVGEYKLTRQGEDFFANKI